MNRATNSSANRVSITSIAIALLTGSGCGMFGSSVAQASPYTELRSNYLEAPVEATAQFEIPQLSLGFQPKAPGLKETSFVPSSNVLFGLGLSYKGYGATVELPLPTDDREVARRGSTRHFDLILHRYWSRGGVDLFYETYRGFYRDAKTEGAGSEAVYEKRPDIEAVHTGANYYHVFSPRRYALDVREQVLEYGEYEAGGSVLGLVSLDFNRLSAVQSFIDTQTAASSSIDPGDLIRSGEFTTLSIGGGYGYNASFGAHALRGQVLAGAGPQRQLLTSVDGTSRERVMTALKVNATGDYAYLLGQNAFGLNVKLDSVNSNLGSMELESRVISVILYAKTRI